MLKALIILLISFSIWFGLVRIFSINNESSINFHSKKFLNDLNLVFRNIIDILDSLFKSFIQVYELFGLILKNIVGIFKSLSSTFIQFINLFNVIGSTLMSFISLCIDLYEETKNITLVNSFEVLLNQTKSAKNNVVKLFKVQVNDLNNKEVNLER